MAFIVFYERNKVTGKLSATMTYAQAVQLQKVMNNPSLGTKSQQAYATKVKSIYLGRQHGQQAREVVNHVNELWPAVSRKDLE